LAAALPNGWQLLVKEHPRQFGGVMDSGPYRDKHFYDQLNEIDKVHLVPMELDNDQLIAQAKATATIGGSVGWQGLLAGKPCLVFGKCWYSACGSCYRIESLAQAQQAMRLVTQTEPSQVRSDVLRFLVYVQGNLAIGAINDRLAAYSKRSPDELARGLAEGLARCLAKEKLEYIK